MQKIAPEEFKQSVLEKADNSWGYEHSYFFTRTVTGLPVDEQGLMVSVGWDGTVALYVRSWEDGLKFSAADHPSFYAVNASSHLGWIAKDTHFRPDDLITREEMAILLAKAAGLDPKAHQKDVLPYADVKTSPGGPTAQSL